MKAKFLRKALCALAFAAVLCGGAFAAENYNQGASGAYTVDYTGKAGEYYAILVVDGIYEDGKMPAITEDSIIYISQETADAEGKVSFADFKTKNDHDGTVYIGGSDLDSAVLLGYVKAPTTGSKVSGSVTSDSGSPVESSVTLTSTTDSSKTFTATTKDGTYEITVPNDTYKFVVTKKAHLSYTKNELAVSEDVVKDVKLVGGDTNADGTINYRDLNSVIVEYNTAGETADINGDGTVNYRDLNVIITNYNANAVAE